MNKIIMIMALVSAGAATLSAQVPADTVRVIDNARNVIITSKDGKTTVTADYTDREGSALKFRYDVDVVPSDDIDREFSDNWGMDFPFIGPRCIDCEEKRHDAKVRRYVTGFRHLYWGWRFNDGDKGNVRNCFEVGIRDLIGVSWQRRGSELEIGAGIGMKRFSVAKGYAYTKDGDRILPVAMEEGVNVRHSRLDMLFFHVPVLYNQHIGRYFKFTLGGVLNLNTYAKANAEFGDDKHHEKISYKGLQQNLVTVDALAAVNIGGFGIYASWSPMKLFNKKYGPELKGWSLGIDLDF